MEDADLAEVRARRRADVGDGADAVGLRAGLRVVPGRVGGLDVHRREQALLLVQVGVLVVVEERRPQRLVDEPAVAVGLPGHRARAVVPADAGAVGGQLVELHQVDVGGDLGGLLRLHEVAVEPVDVVERDVRVLVEVQVVGRQDLDALTESGPDRVGLRLLRAGPDRRRRRPPRRRRGPACPSSRRCCR